MQVIECSEREHANAILEIFNETIRNSTALWEYSSRSAEDMARWFAGKRAGGYPVIGIEDARGLLLGFASYGPFRVYPAYKYSIEHSVYVHAAHRGQGLGERLLSALIERARQQQYHCLVGAIDASNTASIALHRRLGFEHAGTIRHAGFKFGRWLDLALYQRLLDTPTTPEDG